MRRAAVLILCLLFAALEAQQPAAGRPEIGHGVFRGRPVTFEIINGLAIVEGDIILGPASEIQAAAEPQKALFPDRREAIARDGDRYLWPSGTIPYTIDTAIPNVQRIQSAIQHWNDRTNIRLIPRTDQANYLHFLRQNANGVCSSYVGMIQGRQLITVDDLCGVGTMIHEIGHTVGLYHEQSRHDRDAYVQVLYENVESGYESQFDQPFTSGYDIGSYDYGSIMHYSAGAFSKNTNPTIITFPPAIPIGQRSGLSAADIDAVARLYKTPPAMTTVTTNPEGLEVEVDGVKYVTPRSFAWAPGSLHTLSAPAVIPISASARWSFSRWSDEGERTHTIVAGPSETVYTANFQRQVRLTASVSPAGAGAVSVAPPAVDGYYAQGATLQVTARSGKGYSFSHWTLPGGRELHGRSANPAVLAAAAYEYTANFTREPLTTITTQPEGLTITVNGTSMLSPASFAWPAGSTHTVSVQTVIVPTGSTDTRYRFTGWADSGPQSRTITAASAPAVYTARFNPLHRLTAGTSPQKAGTVRVNPAVEDGFYEEGSTVELVATAASGYKFARWSGDLFGGANPLIFTVTRPNSVVANFGVPGEVSSGNVLSSATLLRSPAVPGKLFTIFGVDIGPEREELLRLGADGLVEKELAGTRVLFDNVPAPLIYVSRNQINAVAPFSVAGKTAVVMRVEAAGRNPVSALIQVADARPGIFTLDSSGKGQGAILNEDGTVNSPSNPAQRGSVVVLYATGAGQMTPSSLDGQVASPPLAKPLLPVRVRIGGRLAEIDYCGAAPDYVTGVLQVNARVPADIPPGKATTVLLMVGDQVSSTQVTMAVK